MAISAYHIIGIILAVSLIEIFGIVSMRRVRNSRDFDTGGGRAGALTVCGIIMGTLIGGQSTIGTAQLAFSFGISAWWFTLGAALGCVFLAFVYVVKIRKSGTSTLLEIVSKEYGRKVEVTASVLCSIGIFVSIVAQIVSSSALLMTLFPMRLWVAALASAVIMVLFVVFGGVWSAGIGGIVKLALLCVSSLTAGLVVLYLSDGYNGLFFSIKGLLTENGFHTVSGLSSSEDVMHRYSNLFARGFGKDIGSCISVILGVLSTQSYAQGVYAAKSDGVAKKSALISALLTIPIGAACVFVGLYMRGHYITADECRLLTENGIAIPDEVGVLTSSAQAFPVFITTYIPKLLGGIMLGTLLVTVIIGGSGLSLGASAILVRDVFMRLSEKTDRHILLASRLTIVFLLAAAVIVGVVVSGGFINDLGFLSMGLRATAVFIPLTLSMILPGRFDGKRMLTAVIIGTLILLTVKLSAMPIDPTFPGIAAVVVVALTGYRRTMGRG